MTIFGLKSVAALCGRQFREPKFGFVLTGFSFDSSAVLTTAAAVIKTSIAPFNRVQ